MGSSASFFAASALLCLTIAPAAPAETLQLAPYKDDLFRYRPPIVSDLGGDHLTVPFDHQRDVIARDEIPDEKTRPEYVSLDVKASEADVQILDKLEQRPDHRFGRLLAFGEPPFAQSNRVLANAGVRVLERGERHFLPEGSHPVQRAQGLHPGFGSG